MSTKVLFLSFCLLFLYRYGYAQLQSNESTTQNNELNHPVKELYLSSIEAFNSGDLERFLLNFSSDIKMYGTDGIYEGKQALRERFKEIFQRFPDNKMEIPELRLDVISSEVVLVHFKWKVYPLGKGPAYSGKGSGLYLKQGDKWVESLEVETVTEVDEALKQKQ